MGTAVIIKMWLYLLRAETYIFISASCLSSLTTVIALSFQSFVNTFDIIQRTSTASDTLKLRLHFEILIRNSDISTRKTTEVLHQIKRFSESKSELNSKSVSLSDRDGSSDFSDIDISILKYRTLSLCRRYPLSQRWLD